MAGGQRIEAGTVLWAAGIAASGIARSLGVALDRAGRVLVQPDLSVPGHPDVFVIGDLASLQQDGQLLPGVAQVAIQMGRHAARGICRSLAGQPRVAFRYRDYGNMATIGRAAAIADFGWLRLSGWPAWVAWLFLHIMKLVGFRNRLGVLLQWAWAFVTYQRSVRLITGRWLHTRVNGNGAAVRTPSSCCAAARARAAGRGRPGYRTDRLAGSGR